MASIVNSLCFVILLLMINSHTYIASQLPPVSIAPTDGLLPNGNFEEAPDPSNLKKITIVGKFSLPKWVKRGLVRWVSGGHKQVGATFNVSRGVHAVSIGYNANIFQYLKVKKGTFYSITFSATRTCPIDKYITVSPYASQLNTFINDIPIPSKTLYLSKEADTFAWAFDSTIADKVVVSFSNVNPAGYPKYLACGPLVQAVAMKELVQLYPKSTDNLIENGNFEVGPHILENFTTGVYIQLNTYAQFTYLSPLLGWTVNSANTIKYIGSKDFFIPSGSYAVELLVGGKKNAIVQSVETTPKKYYKLTFTIGDANNGCLGSMKVGASADKVSVEVEYESQGKGGVAYGNLTFQAVSLSFQTKISFWSVYSHTATDDPTRLCGPVLDNVRVVPA